MLFRLFFPTRSISPPLFSSSALSTRTFALTSALHRSDNLAVPSSLLRATALMDQSRTPHSSQDVGQISQMLSAMKDSSKSKGSARFKFRTYNISDQTGRTVDSWSLNDWDYKKSSLPTYARGLFTHSNNGKPEIAARGYDKFFNVGEVRKTEWRNVEQNTRGPYELSVKENGCIIFIAGLDDDTLLVTSKHSTGPRRDDSANHALAGEKWIDRQLQTVGKSRALLAKRLRAMNATAVAELCDDEFEEHVLEYKPQDAGLYLHGINLNLPEFATYPGRLLHDFSDEWGFRKVMFVVKDDIQTVKTFLEGVAETGNYDGRDTEGFVIRCQAREGPESSWHDWFFKYKFEEPYLMYRQWREVTKSLIAGKPPKYRKHQKITKEYLAYAKQQLLKNPELGKQFNKNHGIIAMRNGFLHEKGVKGSDIIKGEAGDEDDLPVTRDVVLVPIATIGCGKTTVAVTLAKLFGWGHVQNDNVTVKKGRPQKFAQMCLQSLAEHNVLISDRNNHQRREREQIIKDMQHAVPDARFVALHWVHDRGNYDEIKRAMRERVLSRGDNHQTIQAGSKGPQEIIGIMDGFMDRFEPCNPERAPDSAFDLVIDLDVAADSIDNVATIIDKLHEEYPKLFQKPGDFDIENAVHQALSDYRPDIKMDLSRASDKQQQKQTAKDAKKPQVVAPTKKAPRMEFFGVFLRSDRLSAILDAIFVQADSETAQFYNQLKGMRRIQSEFHVTLIHRNGVAGYEGYWDTLKKLWEAQQRHAKGLPLGEVANGNSSSMSGAEITDPKPGLDLAATRVHVQRIVWDGRVMAIQVQLLDSQSKGFFSTNEHAHITVGTANPNIKPFESNDLLKRWAAHAGGIQEMDVRGTVVLDGSVRGVLSR